MNDLTDLTIQLLSRDRSGLFLDRAATERLQAELAGTPDAGLEAVITGLVSLARFLEVEQGSPRAAEVLLALATGELERLRRTGTPARLENLRDRAARFERFGGQRRSFEAIAAPVVAPARRTLLLANAPRRV